MDFFTSDWHLNDELILKVCKRQFKSAARMTEVIVQRANQRAQAKSDNIIHVGDFIQRGLDRGTGDKETQVSAKAVLANLWANVILIEGNHDENNRCHTVGKVLFRKVGKLDCIVQHYPSGSKDYFDFATLSPFVIINICGHVHDKWAFKYDAQFNVLNVNVGIDIYPYMIKECDLATKIEAELKRLGKKAYKFL
jgi:calcineurin-like phosphoesterase family protein